MRVVCLLPARNAAGGLSGWFRSVDHFADAVVALDDGSTDDTATVLEQHPRVEVLLRNPRRESYVGWDDSRNRGRLLAAAARLEPDWIVMLDADERIPESDGVALREFLEQHAVPGFAYGFWNHRMIGDLDHFDDVERSYRVFPYRAGDSMPAPKLHFMPIPTSIPRHRWLLTDLRIQHLGGLTANDRQARRAKYREVDPHGEWDDDYGYTDARPGPLRRFRPRRAHDPVLLESRFHYEGNEGEPDLDGPVVSIVGIVDDASVDEMHEFLDHTRAQELRHPREIIVMAKGEPVADDLARLQPDATVVTVPADTSPGETRNVGLRLARGDYFVCFDAPAELAPGALATLVEAHDRGNAYVAGNVRNLSPTAPGWATYFDGPGYGSFSREALLGVGGFDNGSTGVDARARDRLLAAGHHVAANPLMTFGHRTELTDDAAYLEACTTRGAQERARGTNRGDPVDVEYVSDDDAARQRVLVLRRRGAVAAWIGERRTGVMRRVKR